MRFKIKVMYYLKIGRLWVSDVCANSFTLSTSVRFGWSNESDVVDVAEAIRGISDLSVKIVCMKIEVV